MPSVINATNLPALQQFTQELRLASDTEGRLSWQGGAYFFHEDLNYTNTTANASFLSSDGKGAGFGDYQSARQSSRSEAVFGQATYKILEDVTLRGGLRYTWDQVKFKQDSASYTPKLTDLLAFPNFASDPFYKVAGRGPIPLFEPRFSNLDGNWGKLTWDGSGTYRPSDSVDLYVRIAKGYHAGVITGQAMFSPLEKANPETVTSYETGIKSDWLAKRLRLNFDVFHYDYNGIQLTAFNRSGNGRDIISLINGRGATGDGGEFESTLAVSDDLKVTANIGYVATSILGPTFIPNPVAGGKLDITGRPLVQAPKWTIDLGAEYRYPLGDGREVFATTDWAYRGKETFGLTASVQPYLQGNGFWEGGVSTGYRFGKGEIAFWARNLLDAVALTSVVNVTSIAPVFNEPRTYGIAVKAYF